MNSEFCVAVHALVYLDHKAAFVSSEELADNICTNPARVRKVLARLKAAGLVETREGSEGGSRFCGRAEAVSLAAVARALDVRFVAAGWRSGDVDKACLVSSGMGALMDGILQELNEDCYAKLERQTLADVSRKIFSRDRQQPGGESPPKARAAEAFRTSSL